MNRAQDQPISRRRALGLLGVLGAGAAGLLAALRGGPPPAKVVAGTVR